MRFTMDEIINEAVGEWLRAKVNKIEQDEQIISKDDIKRNYFNRGDNILKFIEQNNFIGLTVYAKENFLDAYTQVGNIEVRDHVFPRLPLYIAAPLYATKDISKIQKLTSTISEIFKILVIDSGLGKPNILNEKITGITEYDDFASFLLTHGGLSTTGKRKYNKENDITLATFIDFLCTNGFDPVDAQNNYRGLIKFIINGDSIGAFKYMVDNNYITLSESLFEEFDIKEDSQIASFFNKNISRNCKLHSPDVEYKDGKIVGGTLVDKLRQNGIGYDMTSDSIQKVPISSLFIIQSELFNTITKYINDGEKIANIDDISLSRGSKFSSASNELKFIIKEYDRYTHSNDYHKVNKNDNDDFMKHIIEQIKVVLINMRDAINEVLRRLGIPEIEIDLSLVDNSNNTQSIITTLKTIIRLDRLS